MRLLCAARVGGAHAVSQCHTRGCTARGATVCSGFDGERIRHTGALQSDVNPVPGGERGNDCASYSAAMRTTQVVVRRTDRRSQPGYD